jgi:hypothetical protein
MAGLTFDTGAPIAADRGDARFWVLFTKYTRERSPLTLPAVVLAQAWRGSRNARISMVALACAIETLDESLARRAGELCGRAGTSDVVDAAIVAGASSRGDATLTSDPSDLIYLAGFASPRPRILDLTRLRLPDA